MSAYVAALAREILPERLPVLKRFFSAGARRKDAASGAAMPDGSFPIKSPKDVHNAMELLHHHDTPAVRAHIKSRAKSLGLGNPFAKDLAGLLDPNAASEDGAVASPFTGMKQGRNRQSAGPSRLGEGPDIVKRRVALLLRKEGYVPEAVLKDDGEGTPAPAPMLPTLNSRLKRVGDLAADRASYDTGGPAAGNPVSSFSSIANRQLGSGN